MNRFEWTEEKKWIDLYISILTNLLSAHGDHAERVVAYLMPKMKPIIEKKWKPAGFSNFFFFFSFFLFFFFPFLFLTFFLFPSIFSEQFGCDPEEIEEMNEEKTQLLNNNVHSCLRALLLVVPALPSIIIKKASAIYPHKSHSAERHTVCCCFFFEFLCEWNILIFFFFFFFFFTISNNFLSSLFRCTSVTSSE